MVACGSGSDTPPPTPASPDTFLVGNARDYRRAATAYAAKCADGCGDLAACRSLFDLEVRSRGIAPKLADFSALVRMCARDDMQACSIVSIVGLVHSETDVGHPEKRCADGDASACRMELGLAYFGGLSPTEGKVDEAAATAQLERQMTNSASTLCKGGMIDACKSMVEHELSPCLDRADCITTVSEARRARKIDPAPLMFAWERVQQACGAGDADACELVPGKHIAPKSLCDAGDFVRCAELGKKGDASAAKVACDAGLGASCVPPRDAGGTAESVVTELQHLRERCLEKHEPDACDAFKAIGSPPACK